MKIPLLIMGVIFLFAFSVGNVSAADNTTHNTMVLSNNLSLSTGEGLQTSTTLPAEYEKFNEYSKLW